MYRFAVIFFFVTMANAQPRVRLGADVLIERHLDLLNEKRIGLITNHTGRLPNGVALVDTLLSLGLDVEALFGPEHGIRGVVAAGKKVGDERDSITNIIVYSLYGENRKPTPAMLANIDILVYDIQDVGARFYTYISTMGLAMEAASEAGIPFVVLDRPNPLGGQKIDGPLLEDSLRSFVGMYPLPVVYGLTCGELARMIDGEGWLGNSQELHLIVIQMDGWRREMLWDATALDWVSPSPNIPTARTALIYPATCFVESTNLSEGRGTSAPFENIGSPFMVARDLIEPLDGLGFEGIRFTPADFTPISSKYADTLCHGVHVEVESFHEVEPVLAGLGIIQTLMRLYPSHVLVRESSLKRLLGSTRSVELVLRGTPLSDIAASWKRDLDDFSSVACRYHLYP